MLGKRLDGHWIMSIKILFLEDDLLFAQSVIDLLDENGYHVTHCLNSKIIIDKTFQFKFDLYLLDINVSILNGIQVLHGLRDAGDNTPAIFLTSYQDKKMMTNGFDCGCDDYIKKPFDNDELLLRICAVLKRSNDVNNMEYFMSLSHDLKHKQFYFNTKKLILKPKEYLLLKLLINNYNKTVTKEMIIYELWNIDENISDGVIRVYINRLRQTLKGYVINNIRGVGYELVLSS